MIFVFPAKKILPVLDDCLITEISKDKESSHPADEYNDYWLSSGLPEAFFGCGFVYLYFYPPSREH